MIFQIIQRFIIDFTQTIIARCKHRKLESGSILLSPILLTLSLTTYAQDKAAMQQASASYQPNAFLQIHKSTGTVKTIDGKIKYEVVLGCADIKGQKPGAYASICYTSYTAKSAKPSERPVIFLYNGGPGSSSGFLHMGVAGPYTFPKTDDGSIISAPYKLINNELSWLSFADLVFVDPVGTGFSRQKPMPGKQMADSKAKDFLNYRDDLDAIAQLIEQWLTINARWSSPLIIGGESFGGWRTAALSHDLTTNYSITISGAIIISPMMDSIFVDMGNPMNFMLYVAEFPTFAATAGFYGKSSMVGAGGDFRQGLDKAEAFATNQLLPFLASGAMQSAASREDTLTKISQYLGLDLELVKRKRGAISDADFASFALRDQNKILGMYDLTQSAWDPAPEVDGMVDANDPSKSSLSIFKSTLMQYFTEVLKVKMPADKKYIFFDPLIIRSFDFDDGNNNNPPSTADELSTATQLFSSDAEFMIAHGVSDAVTPYFSSKMILANIPMKKKRRQEIQFELYEGGHMFYLHKKSERSFYQAVSDMVGRVIAKVKK